MQSEVLHGLQYDICEIYIDDIIIFADNEEELTENLRKVLERLAKHNISVSPEKCSFGLQEIEFVGHTLTRMACISQGLNSIRYYRYLSQ